jgi:hypothetical protein
MHKFDEPKPITRAEQEARGKRFIEIGRTLGFVGSMEYRHVYSRSGGGQYCIGPSHDKDVLLLYAEAFERDADPDDFSLEAIIAHECGHQHLIRNKNLRAVLEKLSGEQFEEILASLVGSLLLGDSGSAQTLVWKATAELDQMGMPPVSTATFIERLRRLLRKLL